MAHDPTKLPDSLPRPVDDGAAAHLAGAALPAVPLRSTAGGFVDLAGESRTRRVVVFIYPRTGQPGVESPDGWDAIPGARGCTPQACGFRDLSQEFAALQTTIYGLSTQDTAYQQEAATRLQLPFALLSDEQLALTTALGLPTFEVDGMTLLRRMSLVIEDGRISHVLYPVFPPDRSARDVLDLIAGGAAADIGR
ncbi:MAG: peroxiredoxin [Nocardioidaceae bacterium]